MEATIVNPRRRRRAAKKRTRRNDANPRRRRRNAIAANPRRRVARRRSRRMNEGNPRRYARRTRRNPELDFGRIAASTGGGALLRVLMRKIGGLRNSAGKLTAMQYLTAAGAIYFMPDLAGLVSSDPTYARSAQDGAAGLAGNMLLDEHFAEFTGKHLLPMRSPFAMQQGETVPPAAIGAGGAASLPAGASAQTGAEGVGAAADYRQLMGLAQAGGQFVTRPDGSVWWYPQPAMAGAGLGESRDLPEGARVGDTIVDDQTGERFRYVMRNGVRYLEPIVGGADGVGQASNRDYLRLMSEA
jgi:hypothetical protein